MNWPDDSSAESVQPVFSHPLAAIQRRVRGDADLVDPVPADHRAHRRRRPDAPFAKPTALRTSVLLPTPSPVRGVPRSVRRRRHTMSRCPAHAGAKIGFSRYPWLIPASSAWANDLPPPSRKRVRPRVFSQAAPPQAVAVGRCVVHGAQVLRPRVVWTQDPHADLPGSARGPPPTRTQRNGPWPPLGSRRNLARWYRVGPGTRPPRLPRRRAPPPWPGDETPRRTRSRERRCEAVVSPSG
jgi:hypothetical protein